MFLRNSKTAYPGNCSHSSQSRKFIEKGRLGTFSLSLCSIAGDGDLGSYLPIFLTLFFSVNKISRAARRNSRALNEANPLSSSRTPSCSRGFRDASIAGCSPEPWSGPSALEGSIDPSILDSRLSDRVTRSPVTTPFVTIPAFFPFSPPSFRHDLNFTLCVRSFVPRSSQHTRDIRTKGYILDADREEKRGRETGLSSW